MKTCFFPFAQMRAVPFLLRSPPRNLSAGANTPDGCVGAVFIADPAPRDRSDGCLLGALFAALALATAAHVGMVRAISMARCSRMPGLASLRAFAFPSPGVTDQHIPAVVQTEITLGKGMHSIHPVPNWSCSPAFLADSRRRFTFS